MSTEETAPTPEPTPGSAPDMGSEAGREAARTNQENLTQSVGRTLPTRPEDRPPFWKRIFGKS